MSRKNIFTLRNRVFLNPVSTGTTSYIFAEAQSSQNGEDKWGHYMLTIADCRRNVNLEFFLGTKASRRVSLQKIHLLMEVLTSFREALIKETELIEKFEQSTKRKKSSR